MPLYFLFIVQTNEGDISWLAFILKKMKNSILQREALFLVVLPIRYITKYWK